MLRLERSALILSALLMLATPVAGCATHYIPNTDVEDTDENRRLIAFCERYRHAVENKDIAALLKMASAGYYEDGGNVDPTDDIDYAGLKDYLASKFQQISAIRYEIRYRKVQRQRDRVFVEYTYSASYRIPGSKGDEWRHRVEDNRIELVPYQDNFRIVAGM